jgi:hypothetical protein
VSIVSQATVVKELKLGTWRRSLEQLDSRSHCFPALFDCALADSWICPRTQKNAARKFALAWRLTCRTNGKR